MGDNVLNDDFLIEMLESLILSEFKEKDYTIFDQQILGVELTEPEFEETVARILKSKSQSFEKKISRIIQDKRRDLLELAFKRAQKCHKAQMTLRFMMFEQNEVGE